MRKRSVHLLGWGLALFAGAGLGVATPARADDYKIGVMHVERILQQSAAAKAAHDRIEQEFKGRDADIARKEQAVRDAAAQLDKDRAHALAGRAGGACACARHPGRGTYSACASSLPRTSAHASSRSSTS